MFGDFETAIWTAKLMLLSIGAVSTFLLFKVALIPCLLQSIVPRFLECVRACLAPPYIYIIVNFIIISIAASSSSADKSTSTGYYEDDRNCVESDGVKVSAPAKCADTDTNHVQSDPILFFSDGRVDAETEDSDAEVVVKRQVTGTHAAFAHSENSPEDDGYDDSLDGTWKAITEGKGSLLEKSDTWNAKRSPPVFPRTERVAEMRKSETFNDRVTALRAGGGFRRETTLLTSQDSLNARVEAFINKFQNDMRIERQQSDMRGHQHG